MSEGFVPTLELVVSPSGYKQIKEEIATMHNTLKQSMDKGLSNEDMAVARAIDSAVKAADDGVDALYAKVTG